MNKRIIALFITVAEAALITVAENVTTKLCRRINKKDSSEDMET